ncbi:C40 family peptidase [Halostreptopolyspora alba]|uniref:C40 family peptidase n=1 Tax=Halostreptopolyspora alba TaxID=2487137 RepID=UPI002690FEE1
MSRRVRSCAGSTVAFAVAFTAFGAPAWADPEPNVQDRPPPDIRVPGAGGQPSSRSSEDRHEDPSSPPVGDTADLGRDAEVEPAGEPRSREYFAVLPETVPKSTVEAVRGLAGVESAEVVDAAEVQVDGESTKMLGVDPSGFRNYAPEPSAESDGIWRGIAEGRIALSEDAGSQRDLEVGDDVEIAGGNGTLTREVWAHATSGISGIDAVTSREVTADLGFPEGNALVVSAPDTDLAELRDELTDTLGEDVSLQLLAEDPEAAPSEPGGAPVGESTVEDMISAAESQIGVPYVWGGETPQSGFDCSGLVQWAFAQTGVSVPRVTHDQWWAGTHVDYADAERGDLIFWRNDPTAPDYISHVAIYLGDGMMLEAPRSGMNVHVTDVRTTNMAGVVRVHTSD